MPKEVSEITEGVAFSRSSESGQIADSQPRVFRIVLNSPTELIDIQQACGVYIGDELRPGAGIYCSSFDARYESNSRMALLCTFQFRSTPSSGSSAGGGDPKSFAPDIRPADWAVSSSLIEVPVYTWTPLSGNGAELVPPEAPINAAGDLFDTIPRYEPMITISVNHWEAEDPTRNCERVGSVNEKDFRIGELNCKKHTLMLRGITAQPAVESYNGVTYRGWNANYEFAYRRNHVKGIESGASRFGFAVATTDEDIGWDIAVPETGFNVLAFNPAAPRDDQDIFGQPLKHENRKIVDDPYALFNGVQAGDRVRAMVKVFEYDDGGASQTPSAQPIPLNPDGTPRKSFGDDAASPPVIVRRYLIYDEYDFRNFNLRGLGN
jgi:hypothetical protein